MKTFLKHKLSEAGLFPVLDSLRHRLATQAWLNAGCTGIAPPPIKRRILIAYLQRFGLNHFIETGTYLGDTLALVAQNKRVKVSSIELDDAYYQAALQRFKNYSNVNLLKGDSGVELPRLVRELTEPALFWLDGHYSGGTTAQGEVDTPVSVELKSILTSPIHGHLILIDDARCFDGTHDYPHLDQLLATVRQDGKYDINVSADIIRLTPKT